ncbi:1-deoxy-D-xylulose-5-phosphate synthase [Petrocella sp. FN5]|uniref:1-deoxy-D-xylulose-5-phosphate synthase n=1 Tax=Petrocella sp. FN5 TaxID=3032002 RepID=UPI0023DA778C|nr:1-deoxy-D-xylulose-5-phosphate synthase [Petrocella sp. FN5]MDF1617010.1 1-deoxy-D-xylulose-5-phosphate synthase [Petrocella sp. FN5]
MFKILDKIHSPKALKSLDMNDLNRLSHEVRKYLVDVISVTGGHLSSNLGVVELTIGLHYVFNSPTDKLIWDVGHQSYVHKILTGRKEALKTVRQYQGLSGFPKRNESEHDCFDVGHSSTSISAAIGYAVARDMRKEDHSVVAIIGDGALTGGMAYEALNNGAQMKKNFIVILNDNQMSIGKNVGGMAEYLDTIRTGHVYKEIKHDVHKVLDHIPVIGKSLTKGVREIKDAFKQVFIPGMFFEEMGYTYLGPIDGHALPQIIKVLNQARRIEGPVLIHINTIKGKGYHHAEINPSKFHGTKPFITKNGEALVKKEVNTKKSYGELMGDKLIQYVKEGHKVAGITAAMPDGTGMTHFMKTCPKAFFDVGIAEQHGVTFAAGLGLSGIKPFVAIYSTFLQRAYDQVLHDVCIQKIPVVFMLDRAGLVGEDGETHQGVFDLSYLNHMPNMTVMAPMDSETFKDMMDFALTYMEGPIAIRYPKGEAPYYEYDKSPIAYGKSEVLEMGKEIAILAVGSMVDEAIKASAMVETAVTVVDARFVKPIDYDQIDRLANTHKHLLVAEENTMIGGYGSEVLRYVHRKGYDIKVEIMGIKDDFIEHGSRNKLMEVLGLTANHIAAYIERYNR